LNPKASGVAGEDGAAGAVFLQTAKLWLYS